MVFYIQMKNELHLAFPARQLQNVQYFQNVAIWMTNMINNEKIHWKNFDFHDCEKDTTICIYIQNYVHVHVQLYIMNMEHTNKISLCSLEVINLTH